jgi:hypothetical protein
VPVRRRSAVVLDDELDRVGAVAEHDLDTGAGAVLARVGQRFLRDPLDGELDAERQRARPSLEPELYGKAGRLRLPDELGELVDSRLRCEPELGAILAEQSEQAADLDQRAAARLLHGADRLERACGSRSKRSSAAAACTTGGDEPAVHVDLVHWHEWIFPPSEHDHPAATDEGVSKALGGKRRAQKTLVRRVANDATNAP